MGYSITKNKQIEIVFLGELHKSSDAYCAVPDGYRIATLSEVKEKYSNDEGFRADASSRLGTVFAVRNARSVAVRFGRLGIVAYKPGPDELGKVALVNLKSETESKLDRIVERTKIHEIIRKGEQPAKNGTGNFFQGHFL